MKRLWWGSAAAAAFVLAVAGVSAQKLLTIYFIDVEGGQSTLMILPAGETVLVDAGFASTGTWESKPGDPAKARDAQRILAAAKDAKVTRLDYLLVTHFHNDHMGGVPEVSKLLPIATFIDHGDVKPAAEANSPGTLDGWKAYDAIRSRARHIEPRAGQRLLWRGVEADIVSTDGQAPMKPLSGAAGRNAYCGAAGLPAGEPTENPRSTGFRLKFGRFRFLDVGDLTGPPLFALACPNDMIGPIDVYLVTHHGGADAAEPATFAAWKPRAAIVNNGPDKGGHRDLLSLLEKTEGLDAWQLHRATAPSSVNTADARIANLDDKAAHWLKLVAREDGAFTITNSRTKQTTTYPKP
jgi:beta-lactamase superfamily II metal-dependent hydrolase